MAVPRNRLSNSRKNLRRAHHAKVKKNFAKCSQCGEAKLSHMICPKCKTYGTRFAVANPEA
ncbi:MAG: 50S ribosomal protein L32 [Chlamydiia bacterium]|nr:50S ribosomal protein L32 [Chlamydiia bacterium]